MPSAVSLLLHYLQNISIPTAPQLLAIGTQAPVLAMSALVLHSLYLFQAIFYKKVLTKRTFFVKFFIFFVRDLIDLLLLDYILNFHFE